MLLISDNPLKCPKSSAIDKTLQRLVNAGEPRRIDRGLYGLRRKNTLTGQLTTADYRAVIRAAARQDQARTVVDGMTPANDLSFTTAVPARIEVLINAWLKPIKLGKQEIHFKYVAPSRLYSIGLTGQRRASFKPCIGCKTCCLRTPSVNVSGQLATFT